MVRVATLEAALREIANGQFPPTREYFENGKEMSYEVVWGSNGARDFMRNLASDALRGSLDD